ncbi:MAG: hypothetical protein AAGA81_13280 [Acidobacteriota bacterium]
MSLVKLLTVLAAGLGAVSTACDGGVVNRHYQTVEMLRGMLADEARQPGSIVSATALEDAWGRRILVRRDVEGGLLLVSLGGDGKLDVPNIDDYFVATPRVVLGEADADIVVWNGVWIRDARGSK